MIAAPLINALVSETREAWADCREWMRGNLPPHKRVALACEAIRACDADGRAEVIAALTGDKAPSAPMPGAEGEEARAWAGMADRTTLKIYSAAIWREMSDIERAAFRRWISDQEAAQLAAE